MEIQLQEIWLFLNHLKEKIIIEIVLNVVYVETQLRKMLQIMKEKLFVQNVQNLVLVVENQLEKNF